MKALFSHTYNPYSEYDTTNYIKMAAMANDCAKKQGFETVFFGDELALKNFKKIKYTHTQRIPERVLKDLPKCFWAGGKLLALSSMNEPCIHIDNDLFITKPILNNYLKNDIFCFHDEHFAMEGLTKMQDLYKIRPPETIGQEIMSYNCGIMGGDDIETIRKSIDIVLNFTINNSLYIDMINNIYNEVPEFDYFFYTPVLIEQIWLFQIYKSFGKKISPLLYIENWAESFESNTRQSGYIHLMQAKSETTETIDKYINKYNISY